MLICVAVDHQCQWASLRAGVRPSQFFSNPLCLANIRVASLTENHPPESISDRTQAVRGPSRQGKSKELFSFGVAGLRLN